MTTEMAATALIVAAGRGERLGRGIPKQYRPIGGKSVLQRAVTALMLHPRVTVVRVVVGAGQEALAHEALAGLNVGELIIGGEHRADSVKAGLDACSQEIVLVHDAARPFCPPDVVDRLLVALDGSDGAVPVLPIGDTMARANARLGAPIDRTHAMRVQTPQAFKLDAIRRAYASWTGVCPTDDATVARAAGIQVAAVPGDWMLEKLTTPEDWARAETLLAARLTSRTGLGFDVHSFAGTGPIMLGGISIPHARGLAGHSDADVVLHAITDALLGAAALGDIGDHFPPSDSRWKGASSAIFLSHAALLIRDRGGIIDHVDCTIIGEEPKVAPYRSAIRAKVAEILEIRIDRLSIKATTTERLGFTGRGEGLAAQAAVTVRMEAAE